MTALTTTAVDSLPLIARGKVRDIYAIPSSPSTLLFVATDRISAYDVILNNGIPQKGKILTQLSKFWFHILHEICPNHFITDDIPSMPLEVHPSSAILQDRSMLVKKCSVIPVEAIVRGYITGSGWKEYKTHGTVHGMAMPVGLQESAKLAKPIFTPSTKAEQGEHDENIHPDRLKELIGAEKTAKIERLAIALYSTAAEYAESRGIIIADTKFEFGETESGEIILIDEVLTPDSSRFWPKDKYVVGQGQESFDKQYLRDWLTRNNLQGVDNVDIPSDIVDETHRKYKQVYEILTGLQWTG